MKMMGNEQTADDGVLVSRDEESGRQWNERFVNAERAAVSTSMGSAVAESLSYVVLHDFATKDECSILIRSAMELEDIFLREGDGGASFKDIQVNWVTECSRFSVTKLLNEEANRISNVFVRRLLDWLEFGLDGLMDTALSNMAMHLFGTAQHLSDFDVYWYNEMSHDRVSNPEPMVNVYQEGGFFKRHTDMMQLTILVVLAEAVEGGGTAFYTEQRDDELTNECLDDIVPERVETPPVGTAMIWSGKMIHSALPVLRGIRIVYVGSFDLIPKI